MIFWGPRFNPWDNIFDDFFLKLPAKEQSNDVKKLGNGEETKNLATELAKITEDNTVKIFWDKQDSWTDEMRQAYKTIVDGCRAAAAKGERQFVYETEESKVVFAPMYQYLKEKDGLRFINYFFSQSISKEQDKEPQEKQHIKVVFRW